MRGRSRPPTQSCDGLVRRASAKRHCEVGEPGKFQERRVRYMNVRVVGIRMRQSLYGTSAYKVGQSCLLRRRRRCAGFDGVTKADSHRARLEDTEGTRGSIMGRHVEAQKHG